MKPHRVPYIAIYRGSVVPPEDDVMTELNDVRLRVENGPFSFSYSVPIVTLRPSQGMMTLGERSVSVPQGPCILVETEADPTVESERQRVALRVAEVASLITLRFPYVLDEKFYEGPVNTQDMKMLWGEGPRTLTVSPEVTPSQLSEGLAEDMSFTQQLSPERRTRFQLASRWYRRGCEAMNLADKFLFWWTVLEIFPGQGNTKIVRSVKQILSDQVCSQLSPQEVEDKLRIGRIYGERKRIVHEGRAFVDFDDQPFQELLKRLRVIASVCLRLLCGLPPGDDLEEFMDSENRLHQT